METKAIKMINSLPAAYMDVKNAERAERLFGNADLIAMWNETKKAVSEYGFTAEIVCIYDVADEIDINFAIIDNNGEDQGYAEYNYTDANGVRVLREEMFTPYPGRNSEYEAKVNAMEAIRNAQKEFAKKFNFVFESFNE